MPLDHHVRYLLVDDYIDDQNQRDQILINELRFVHGSIDQAKQELHGSIDQVKQDLKEFKDDVKTQFARIDERFDTFSQDINQRFDGLDLQYRRMAAYFRNNNLRNPILPINPIVSYLPGRGIIHPESSLYP
ncbi:hypothetical protein AK830_g11096 [Neonectria ditissima]|uniref:Biogenesis of lysosome-related organelles complex 1 subunit CNL1 n=1 Tax=Neonectria ditissima TaxID=78410 RepID=A0A0P7B257_9HYPO|nr:hypothetical protein AK830_g11096 [Neonectria ditissima]